VRLRSYRSLRWVEGWNSKIALDWCDREAG
jgi:hypothetical protein